MTQIDEPNLDKQIDNILNQAVRKARATDTTKWYFNSDWHKEQIKALIADQVREARLDELERLELRLCKSTQYGIPVVDLQSAIDDRIKELGDDK